MIAAEVVEDRPRGRLSVGVRTLLEQPTQLRGRHPPDPRQHVVRRRHAATGLPARARSSSSSTSSRANRRGDDVVSRQDGNTPASARRLTVEGEQPSKSAASLAVSDSGAVSVMLITRKIGWTSGNRLQWRYMGRQNPSYAWARIAQELLEETYYWEEKRGGFPDWSPAAEQGWGWALRPCREREGALGGSERSSA